MTQTNNFNAVASYYDVLARLAFGGCIRSAQMDAISYVCQGASILIVGGGTGWILTELSKKYPTGLKITYIEQSAKMMAYSRSRFLAQNEVVFLELPVENANLVDHCFDFVVTPFLLDCFSEPLLGTIFRKMERSLKPGGLWLHTDFIQDETTKRWHRQVLKVMYSFFSVVCSIGARQLYDTRELFSEFRVVECRRYFSGFIAMHVFQKPDHVG